MFEDEQTMPLPSIFSSTLRVRDHRPTLRQIRERCGLSYFDVAQAAGVRPRVVYWMEQGIAVNLLDALYILAVLTRRSGWVWTFENVKGIRLKQHVSQVQSHRYQVMRQCE